MRKISIILCLILVTMSFNCFAAEAGRTLYVDSVNGSSDGNGTKEAPFSSLQKACDIVEPGDLVIVAEGIYYGTTVLRRSGTKEKPIIFRAAKSGLHSVTLSGANKQIREGNVKWTLEDAATGLYSIPYTVDPARVTCDDLDVGPYQTKEQLNAYCLVLEQGGNFARGPKMGFAFSAEEKKLYVRLRQDGKYGSANPNDHVMAVPTSGVYDKYMYDGVLQGGYKGDVVGEDSYIFGVINPDAPTHVVLDGFTFEAPGYAAVYIRSSDVTVRNAFFRGCRAGVHGGTRFTNDIYETDNIIVESCDYTQFPTYEDAQELIEEYHTDTETRASQFFWWQRKGMESGYGMPTNKDYETGGFVSSIGNNWILRNNNLYSCFDTFGWKSFATYRIIRSDDKAQEFGGSRGGGVKIYNNIFSTAVDNAIELENRSYNVEFYNNEFINNYMGISWQPMGGKTWPTNINFHNNLFYNTEEHGKMWMEKAGYSGSFVKIGAQKDSWGWWPWMADEAWDPIENIPLQIPTPEDRGMTFTNNTIYSPYTLFLEKTSGDAKMKLANFNYINNIFITHPRQNNSLLKLDMSAGHPVHKDLGVYYGNNLYAPSSEDLWFTTSDITLNGGLSVSGPSKVGFVNIENMDFTLREDSIARGKGRVIDGQPYSSVDLGAVPYGKQYRSPEVGPRPFGDVTLDGNVDVADLAYLKAKTEAPVISMEADYFCDLDFNGVVNQADYDLLVNVLSEE